LDAESLGAYCREQQEDKLAVQKLLYYAQWFCYREYNVPLFKDQIEAWKYGPVVPIVWKNFDILNDPTKDPEIQNLFDALRQSLIQRGGPLIDLVHNSPPWTSVYVAGANKPINLEKDANITIEEEEMFKNCLKFLDSKRQQKISNLGAIPKSFLENPRKWKLSIDNGII